MQTRSNNSYKERNRSNTRDTTTTIGTIPKCACKKRLICVGVGLKLSRRGWHQAIVLAPPAKRSCYASLDLAHCNHATASLRLATHSHTLYLVTLISARWTWVSLIPTRNSFSLSLISLLSTRRSSALFLLPLPSRLLCPLTHSLVSLLTLASPSPTRLLPRFTVRAISSMSYVTNDDTVLLSLEDDGSTSNDVNMFQDFNLHFEPAAVQDGHNTHHPTTQHSPNPATLDITDHHQEEEQVQPFGITAAPVPDTIDEASSLISAVESSAPVADFYPPFTSSIQTMALTPSTLISSSDTTNFTTAAYKPTFTPYKAEPTPYKADPSFVPTTQELVTPYDTWSSPSTNPTHDALDMQLLTLPMTVTNGPSMHTDSTSTSGVYPSGLETPVCTLCNKAFPDATALKSHRRKEHPKPKLYPCHVKSCKVRFSARCNLSKHVKSVHEQQRPHVCGACGRAFSERNKLVKHEETVHGGQRPYACVWRGCTAEFGQKSDRTRHVNVVHRNERRYQCRGCKKFGRKSSLAQHLLRVHGLRQTAVTALIQAATDALQRPDDLLVVSAPGAPRAAI